MNIPEITWDNLIVQGYKMQTQLIPQKKVMEMTSLSGTTIWRMEKTNSFPKRHKIGPNRVAWLQSEIEEWISSKVEASNDL